MTIKVPYVKMNGLGNEFVLIDTADLPSPQTELSQAQDMCLSVPPPRGIGCDQVLQLTEQQDGSYLYRIRNSSGSHASQCGNGARCAYDYLKRSGRLKDGKAVLRTDQVTIEVIAGATGPHAFLSKPSFNPEEIPFKRQQRRRYQIHFQGQDYEFTALGLGNPHACLWVDDAQAFPLEDLKFAFSEEGSFYEGVNISLLQRTGDQEIILRVYERGAGETKACGSAAAAAACVFFQDYQCNAITVKMPGGELKAGWDGEGSVWIEGAVEFEHKGHFILPQVDVHPARHVLEWKVES